MSCWPAMVRTGLVTVVSTRSVSCTAAARDNRSTVEVKRRHEMPAGGVHSGDVPVLDLARAHPGLGVGAHLRRRGGGAGPGSRVGVVLGVQEVAEVGVLGAGPVGGGLASDVDAAAPPVAGLALLGLGDGSGDELVDLAEVAGQAV